MQNIYWPATLFLSAVVSIFMLNCAKRFEPATYVNTVHALNGQRVFMLCAAALLGLLGIEATCSLLQAESVQYEPEGASLIAAWLYAHGQPLYHSADSVQRYSLLYGPLMYLPFSAIFKLGGGMVAARCVGIAGVMVSGAGMWLIVRASRLRGYLFLCALGVVILAIPQMFTGRADAISYSAVVLGACAAAAGNVVALALLAGVAAGCKATAVLYFGPLLYMALQLCKPTLTGWISAMLVFGAVVLLPFSLPGVSLPSYLYWLREAGKHGLVPSLFLTNVVVLLVLAAPALWAAVSTRAWRHQDRGPWRALCVTLGFGFLLSVPAAKIGSGSYHLIPFAPAFALLLARAAHWHVGLVQRSSQVVYTAFLLLSFLFMSRHAHTVLFGEESAKVPLAALAEIDRYTENARGHGAISMGAGELSHRQTNAALYVLRHGGRYLFNDVTMWDMEGAGLPIPKATVDAIARCDIPNWLIPAGDLPFHSGNLYFPQRQIFVPVDTVFAQHYVLAERGHYFDLWRCRVG